MVQSHVRVHIETFESRDYLIATSDLVLNGISILPQRGDVIAETVGDTEVNHEVLAPAGMPVWRYCDPYRTMLRIHTKRIGDPT